jgi:deoxyribonuclease-1
MRALLLALALLLPALPAAAQAPTPPTPRVATSDEALFQGLAALYAQDRRTRDCGCPYTLESQPGIPAGSADAEACGFQPLRVRADPRLEPTRWAYLVHPSEVARGRACWRGETPLCQAAARAGQALDPLACCKATDPEVAGVARDLFNLMPFLDGVDELRAGGRLGPVASGARPFGRCEVRWDSAARTLEPAPMFRGEIARGILYMHRVWRVPLSPAQVEAYARWSAEHPPTAQEIARALRIAERQLVLTPEVPIPGMRFTPEGITLPPGGPTRSRGQP